MSEPTETEAAYAANDEARQRLDQAVHRAQDDDLADELDRSGLLILGVRPGEAVHVNGADGLEFSNWILAHAAFFADADGLPAAVASLTLRRTTPLADGDSHEERVTIPWHAVHTIQPYDTILRTPTPPARSKILTPELGDDEWENG